MERKPVRELVKNQEWQKVRKDLIGKWKSDPIGCCKKLRSFLGSVKSANNDKLRIVMNYLTGTAFRTGRVKHPCITTLRGNISMEMGMRKKSGKWYG